MSFSLSDAGKVKKHLGRGRQVEARESEGGKERRRGGGKGKQESGAWRGMKGEGCCTGKTKEERNGREEYK